MIRLRLFVCICLLEKIGKGLNNGSGHKDERGIVEPNGLVLDLQYGPAYWTRCREERIDDANHRCLYTECRVQTSSRPMHQQKQQHDADSVEPAHQDWIHDYSCKM